MISHREKWTMWAAVCMNNHRIILSLKKSRAVEITSWSVCQDWSGFWNTLTHGQNSSRRVSNDSTVHPLIAALTLYHSQYKRYYWCALQEMKVQCKRPQCVCVRTLHLPLRVSACFRPASHNWPADWHNIGQLGFTEVLTAAVKTQFWLKSTNSMKGKHFVEEMSKNLMLWINPHD